MKIGTLPQHHNELHQGVTCPTKLLQPRVPGTGTIDDDDLQVATIPSNLTPLMLGEFFGRVIDIVGKGPHFALSPGMYRVQVEVQCSAREWLEQYDGRMGTEFAPPAKLNLVERWFALITGQTIRRGSFDSVRALERAINRFLATWNADAKPFRWTKSARAINKPIARVIDHCRPN